MLIQSRLRENVKSNAARQWPNHLSRFDVIGLCYVLDQIMKRLPCFFTEETQCCVYLMLISAWMWQSWGEAIAQSLTHSTLRIIRRLSLWAMLFPRVANYKIKSKFKQYLLRHISNGFQEYGGLTETLVTPKKSHQWLQLCHTTPAIHCLLLSLVPDMVAVL